MNILMVCLGNICRSPIAEGVMRSIIYRDNLNWKVASAGTESYHIGEPPHTFSQKICQSRKVDISKQRARRFVATDLQNFDKIYAMSEDVLDRIKQIAGSVYDERKVSLFLNELYPGSNRSVPDPWYGPEEGYTEVFEMIEKTCHIIAGKYKHNIAG
jgi:protein-tyrosine phosphatase